MDVFFCDNPTLPPTLWPVLLLNASRTQGHTCQLSAAVKLEQIARHGLVPIEEHQLYES